MKIHPNESPLHYRLTEEEKKIIRMTADGSSTKMMVDEIGKPFHAINSTRRRIMRKSGANNTAHMVAIAMRVGII